MFQSIKDIDPKKIISEKEFQNVLVLLLNVIEDIQKENAALKLDKQRLQDENNVLKGGNARPVIKGSKKHLRLRDISSKGKEKGDGESQSKKKNTKAERDPVEIDQDEIIVDMDKSQL